MRIPASLSASESISNATPSPFISIETPVPPASCLIESTVVPLAAGLSLKSSTRFLTPVLLELLIMRNPPPDAVRESRFGISIANPVVSLAPEIVRIS